MTDFPFLLFILLIIVGASCFC
ncbi:YjcZ family sporulation protein [Bacillus mycoides]